MPKLLQMVVAIIFGVLPLLTCAQDRGPTKQPSILKSPGENIRLQLFDAWSGELIANTDINVESDNGIRCIKAPCPTNGKQWAGRSDGAGLVTIPKSVLQVSTYVRTELHESANLEEAAPGASGIWVIELFPNRLKGAGEINVDGHKLDGLDVRGYKLVDAETAKPLINKPVHIEFPLTGTLDTKTNWLGYVFFTWERTLGSSEPEAWVIVRGYQKTKLDLDNARQGTKLKK